MGKLFAWAVEGRIHSASLTIPGVLLGYLIAGGELWSFKTILWALFGLAWHFVGMVDNNFCDFEYDRCDPAKSHFPHINGTISIDSMRAVVYSGYLLVFLFGLGLSNFSVLSLFSLCMVLSMGRIYNLTSKKTVTSSITISLSAASMILFSYFSTTIELHSIILFMALYVYLQFTFQIAYSGSYKELENYKEANLLRYLGAKVKRGRFIPNNKTIVLGVAVKSANLAVAGVVVILYSQLYYTAIVVGLSLLCVWYICALLSERRYNRGIKEMSIVEMTSYFIMIVMLGSILGIVNVAIFIFAPLIWFIVLNKLFWKEGYLCPKV